MFKLNEIIEVKAVDLSYEGFGVCKVNGIIVFVEGLLIEETALVKIVKKNKKFYFASIVEILQFSDKRVVPECELYNSCGGCKLSHMSNDLKRKVKIGNVKNLSRKLDLQIIDCMDNLDELGYRNKVVMHVDFVGEKIIAGPYTNKTNTVVGSDCLLLCNEGRKLHEFVLSELNSVANKSKLKNLSNIIYRSNNCFEFMVIFVVYDMCDEIIEIQNSVSKIDKVVSIYSNVKKKGSKHLMGDKNLHLYGQEYLINEIGELKYKVSPTSFFQVNNRVCKSMFDTIVEECNFTGNEVVLDAYCGTGAIGLYVSKYVKEVVGIDISSSSIIDAKQNILLNDITNATYYQGDIFKKLNSERKKFDLVIIDPPRSGCDKKFLELVVNSNYSKVVYMSCNPSTLIRDLEFLIEKGYQTSNIKVFDMFSQTAHVESIVVLTKDNKKSS